MLESESVSHSGMSDSLRPMNYKPPGSSTHGILQARILLLQEIFLIQGSNLGLPHCRQILYHLSHQESPITEYNWSTQLFYGVYEGI